MANANGRLVVWFIVMQHQVEVLFVLCALCGGKKREQVAASFPSSPCLLLLLFFSLVLHDSLGTLI